MADVNERKASDLSRRVAIELKNEQRRRGFLWADIEKATGIAHQTMSRMLNAKTDIPINRLMLICEAAGLDAADVISEATRHMPDNYLQSLLNPVSDAPDNVTGIQSRQDWDTFEGKKVADTDEVNEDPKT